LAGSPLADAADIDENLILMKRGMVGSPMPPGTARLIQKTLDAGSIVALKHKEMKRAALHAKTLGARNQKRQHDRLVLHQRIRDIAAKLKADRRRPRGTEDLARHIQKELPEEVSTRTIRRALNPKK
jgi:hypothetical protein